MWAELEVDGKRRILASGANWTKKEWGKGEGAISTPFLGGESVWLEHGARRGKILLVSAETLALSLV